MKRVTLAVLIVSLGVNVVLVGALSRRWADRKGGPAMESQPAGSQTSSSGQINNGAESAALSLTWSRLASDDLKTTVANLQAAGFPREAIRAVINAMLEERFRARTREIQAKRPPEPYWKREDTAANTALWVEMRALDNERQQIVRDLLGTNVPNLEGRLNRQARYGALSDEKLDAVERIVSDYSDLVSQINNLSGGMNFPGEREQLAVLEKEKRRDLAAILTPDELELYELRASDTARNLRNRLVAFNPTETEFRAIFPLQQVFDGKHGIYSSGNPSPERKQDQEQLNQQIKDVLGEQRYTEYQRAQDYSYRSAYTIAQRLGLPVENALTVHGMQKDYQQRAATIRADKTQTTEQRNAALTSLAAEARTKLDTLLTPQGSQAYRAVGGHWLRSLSPPAPRPAAPAR